VSASREEEARRVLGRVDYYRLLSYMRALQVRDESGVRMFVPGTTMDDVVALYEFDRSLRLLCMDAVERIEVALRAAIVSEIAVSDGACFYTRRSYFVSDAACERFKAAVMEERERNPAIRHYLATYSAPGHPPIWVAMEAVTFGALSQFFSNLARPYRIRIARRFQLNERVLASWFRALNGLRNLCAHHGRVWNASLHINKPMAGHQFVAEFSADTDTFFDRAVVIVLLLDRVTPHCGWKEALKTLIAGSPHVDAARMGFPRDWWHRQLWN
jgi:abortive infection bacteriophage resistance protein